MKAFRNLAFVLSALFLVLWQAPRAKAVSCTSNGQCFSWCVSVCRTYIPHGQWYPSECFCDADGQCGVTCDVI
jgi:MinD superfamily P-loop ATPase